jgi:signal peptidase I
MEENRQFNRKEALLFLWEIAKVVLISLAIIIPIRYFLFQPFFVRGASMEPNFLNGDYLIIDEITYRLGDPERGDVVVFRSPQDTSQFFIKRIVGMPGETIELTEDQVIIRNSERPSGFILDESAYLSDSQHTSGNLRLKLDDNEYFVMGDNRLQSSDSRRWGPVNESYLIGRAIFRAWPVSRFSGLEEPHYRYLNY